MDEFDCVWRFLDVAASQGALRNQEKPAAIAVKLLAALGMWVRVLVVSAWVVEPERPIFLVWPWMIIRYP